ncbi:b3082bd3-e768-4bcf-bfbf-295394ef4ce5 [Sclerotinia trifoliorum]|uniref:B3082bd3-e768-4bcf-bfbf-295394ef4ce5 n=1 Tax=Sclerotinia trifoliorum TaxID=28548 RepID=A0A8H2VPA7_9HELO|nr:b3082bd3-e768-4bcf-bfbf-295394ef4ce5 [Sclerotinia trifoliorum]
MPPVPRSPVRLAVLDDYQGVALKHFESLKPTVEITTFPDTLLPYDGPLTPEDVKSQLVERLKPFTIISSMRERTPFPASLLEELPNLKLLLNSGNRNKGIDMEAAKKHGISVTGTSVKSKRGPDSTTQHAVALILGIARNISRDDKVVKEGGWQTTFATGLAGKTLGTLGLGKLGTSVAKIMYSAFGMKIIAWSSSLTQEAADQKARDCGFATEDEDGEKVFKVVSKEELFSTSDVVSVHLALGDRSKGIVGEKDLDLMKKSALFVNTSRGPLVQQDALLDALQKGKIRGAALDVFDLEPLPADSQWRSIKWGEKGRSQVLLSPHMGYVEEEKMNDWYQQQAENVQRWLEGKDLMDILV